MAKAVKEKRRVYSTQARASLRTWFEEDKTRTRTALAERLGCAQPFISQLLSGTARPSPARRESIQALCGIPTEWWLTTSERLGVKRASAA